MRTRLTENYQIDWPLAGPGGAYPHSPALAAAVSNAGGLGILGGSPGSPRELASWIRDTRKLTSQPFGVELDLQFAQIEHLEECIKGKVTLVIFGWEPPPETWLMWLHNEGIRGWARAGNLKSAREAVKNGADAVIAHSTDGLRGDHTPTFAMLAGAVQALAPVPVIAGSVSSSHHVVAAMALGAEGVCVGTPLAGKRVTREIVLGLMQGVEYLIRERLTPIVNGPAHSRALTLPQRGTERIEAGPANSSVAPSLSRLLQVLLAAKSAGPGPNESGLDVHGPVDLRRLA